MPYQIHSTQRLENQNMNSHKGAASHREESGTLHDSSRREVSGTVLVGNLTQQQIRQLQTENINLKAHRQFMENSNMALKKELSSFQQENNCLKCNIDVRVVHDALREEIRLLNERVRSIDHENYLLHHKVNDQLAQITNLTRENNVLRVLVPKEDTDETEFVTMYTELDKKLEVVINENEGLRRANRVLVERIQKLFAEKNAMHGYYGD